MSLRHESIQLDAFKDALTRYPKLILEVSDGKQKRKSTGKDADDTLASLDTWRLEDLPEALSTRRQTKKEDDYLEKTDIEKLIRWKLKHGTFRPSLMNLVSSNFEDVIRDTTTRAYAVVSKISSTKSETLIQGIMEALSILTSLRGIGPASASLLLSVRFSQSVPFFSDEAYRWLTYTSGDRWTSSIKYNVKEYRNMLEASLALCKRLGVDAVDVERVGWVLGHEKAKLDQVNGSKRKQREQKEDAKEAREAASTVAETRYSKRTKR